MKRTKTIAMAMVASLLATLLSLAASTSPASAATVGYCPEMTDSVVRLYNAYFLRPGEPGGPEYWSQIYASGQLNIEGISDFFQASEEFQLRYGSLSNGAFVDLVYNNVLDRDPDDEGRAFWINALETGTLSRGGIMIGFSESKEYVEKSGTIRPFAGYGTIFPTGTTWACGKGPALIDIEKPRGPMGYNALGINLAGTSTNMAIWTIGADGANNDLIYNQSMNDGSIWSWAGIADQRSYQQDTSKLEIRNAKPETHWTVVFFPTAMPAPEERGGWMPADGLLPSDLR